MGFNSGFKGLTVVRLDIVNTTTKTTQKTNFGLKYKIVALWNHVPQSAWKCVLISAWR